MDGIENKLIGVNRKNKSLLKFDTFTPESLKWKNPF